MCIDISVLGEKLLTRDVDIQKAIQYSFVYPIRIYHSKMFLGPIWTPSHDKGPCPRCFEMRWIANRSPEEKLALQTHHHSQFFPGSFRMLPSTLETIWLLLEADTWNRVPQLGLQPRATSQVKAFYELDLDSLAVVQHQLIADSDCPICSQAEDEQAEAAYLSLSPRKKQKRSHYRLTSPLSYELPQSGYANPVCGMLGPGITKDFTHTVTAVAGGEAKIGSLNKSFSTIAWAGHHSRFDISERTGILEGLERYCGYWPRTRKSTIFDSYHHLGDDALDLSTCGLYHPNIYQKYKHWITPYHHDLQMAWVWGYSFRRARPILVPEQLAYYATYLKNSLCSVWNCSNGCAIGSCIEEAILYGLFELIERNGFLMSWYARLAPPRIDPWSACSLDILHLLDRIHYMGYDTYFLDTRFDLPIPRVTAAIQRRDDALGKLLVAAAANLDPETAIRSALCEVAAYLPNFDQRVAGKQEELLEMVRDHSKVTELHHHSLIYGFPEMAKHAQFLLQSPTLFSIQDTYSTWREECPRSHDLLDDLQYCLNTIFQLDMDVIVIDQTAPELAGTGLKVVKVIVPGLLPIDFGWGRNLVYGLPRLQTVPRTSGYLDKDFDLADLNITPHPFP
ncbi:TOMM precursor leader peptide-binding protein [Ktedonosporobacter rubrisoli]|nr:TOMM precursor leader peptide-binding protein [Ktedonosporobacter rubrisoli]